MTSGAPLGGELQDYGGGCPELRLRASDRQRARAAGSAAGWVGLLVLPVGIVLSLLSGTWLWVPVVEAWALMLFLLSYFGQGHNAVFVGANGVRRVAHGCSVTAAWSALESIEPTIPGNQIVVFKLNTADLQIRKLGRGRSRAAEVMAKVAPEGFELRLDRASADSLVAEIAQRRPDLPGLSSWETDSRPAAAPPGPPSA